MLKLVLSLEKMPDGERLEEKQTFMEHLPCARRRAECTTVLLLFNLTIVKQGRHLYCLAVKGTEAQRGYHSVIYSASIS